MDGKTTCWFCGSLLVWGSDFTYEDYGLDGEGLVASLSCSNESCGASWEGYLPDDPEE